MLGGEEQAEELPPLTKLLLGNLHVKPGLANDKKTTVLFTFVLPP